VVGCARDAEKLQATQRYELTAPMDGLRLDAALAVLTGVSRAQVQRWISEGCVELDGKPTRASVRVAEGMVVVARPPATEPANIAAEDIPLAVLYEDAHLLVLDKPAGMVVHPAPGHRSGTLVNALLHHCKDLGKDLGKGRAVIGGEERPGIVHRLDRGTSGVMVVAKNDAAHAGLAALFHDHTIERIYTAFVRALPERDEGRVDLEIGRHARDRKRMSVATRKGRAAVTKWCVRERFAASGVSLLEVRPETGRTHQIRVHLSAQGMPIAGDPVYGRARRGRARAGSTRAANRHPGEPTLERPALHAAVLGFEHPVSGQRMRFEAPLPEDLRALLAWLREREQRAGSR
jgi:23S rRNA pseudouridine1911/1915/1917 synthase